MDEAHRRPRASELSKYAPRIIQVQIDPSKIGLLIGKGGETIRGLSEEFESQIDVNDEGTGARSTPPTASWARPCATHHLDDQGGRGRRRVPDGKVVKTTTFGAFVELAKGTDGLLHISNVSPGQRVDTVEDVLNKGDEISVRVVEVDRERGRIGLRLAEDPEIAGKSAEELAAVGGGGGGGNGGAARAATVATVARAAMAAVAAAAIAGRAAPAARGIAAAPTAPE